MSVMDGLLKTTNVHLAAYLALNGAKMKSQMSEKFAGRVVFVFDRKEVDVLLTKYKDERTMVPLVQYTAKVAHLQNIIYQTKDSHGNK